MSDSDELKPVRELLRRERERSAAALRRCDLLEESLRRAYQFSACVRRKEIANDGDAQ